MVSISYHTSEYCNIVLVNKVAYTVNNVASSSVNPQWDSVQGHAHLQPGEDVTVSTVITAVTGHCCVEGHHTLTLSSDARYTFVASN